MARDARSPGEPSTLNTSVWPNDASVSSLSDVIESGPIPPNYYLSPKAARGILHRAIKRRKSLRRLLLIALQQLGGSQPDLFEEVDETPDLFQK